MSVIDDLLVQLRETSGAAPEVDPRRPREASSDGGGAKCSTPEALEAPGTVAGPSDARKAPVLFTRSEPCDDCPFTCCEIDGTCWKVERDEIDRLRAAGAHDTAPTVWTAPWSKRALRDEAERKRLEAEAAESRRQQIEREQKEERKAKGGAKKWGGKPLPGNSPRFVTPKPTPTVALADGPTANGRAKRVRQEGEPIKRGVRNLTDEQVRAAAAQFGVKSARKIAHEHWQEWGFGSPRGAYMGLLRACASTGVEVPDGRKLGGFKTKEAA